jgi:hypothetical protein
MASRNKMANFGAGSLRLHIVDIVSQLRSADS